MPWLFFFAALAIPIFYAVGLLFNDNSTFTTADFWRFWVVHLWVEDFLELFTTVMVAYIFVLLGVVTERIALTVIYLDVVLYSVGGVIGTMHHLYFSGEPAEHMALGAFFSAAEVIPLTFLTVEALELPPARGAPGVPLSRARTAGRSCFLVAVGFWNFLGAGVFGFLINLPIVSYYEIGTALTANHGHTAMMGVYAARNVGLALFCLRYLIPEDRWSESGADQLLVAEHRPCLDVVRHAVPARPGPALQVGQRRLLRAADDRGSTNPTNSLFEWMRRGDVLFIGGGVLPALPVLAWVSATRSPGSPSRPRCPLRRDQRAGRRPGGRPVTGLHPETILLGAYALFLLGAAAVLDLLADHAPPLAATAQQGSPSTSTPIRG